jgi:hypothetical protein
VSGGVRSRKTHGNQFANRCGRCGAVISGTIAIIRFVMNRATTLKTHKQKLAFDRELAEKKVAADIALAEKTRARPGACCLAPPL